MLKTTHCRISWPSGHFINDNKLTLYKFSFDLMVNNLNFNIFNIIIISGVLHGVFFSLITLIQKKDKPDNITYLSLTVLFLSLSNLQYWVFDTLIIDRYEFLKYIYIPWQWLVLPMFYLYVYKFIGTRSIGFKKISLLIGPFVIIVFIHILQLLYKFAINTGYQIPSHFKRGVFVYLEFFSIIFNVLIMYFTYQLIVKHENDKSYNIHWVKSETNWLKKLIYIGLTICVFWLFAIVIVVVFNLNKSYFFYPMWIGISILVYWIGYVGLIKSKQLKERIELRKKRIRNFKSRLSKDKSEPKSFTRIKKLIVENKLFLDPNLNLTSLSKKLNLSEGYISKLINENTQLNFNDFINGLRVDEAKDILKNEDFDNYTILAIGLESGFNSKTSFYTTFKKYTDTTPNNFKKLVRDF
ncbi:MAG: helix-turn-helix domain-containing protein [Flavobacteriaceae bacterium]|nr:MAG: helix-turn-helix domain-containing protein [Flavobacteriaceae bacterium]